MTSFWRGKRVLLTGHTGFKGAWLWLWLERLGATVTGVALPPETDPALFPLVESLSSPRSIIADLRRRDAVAEAVGRADPQIVFHLAAQAIVREGYRDPLGTVATNVLGTAHLLEALRGARGLQAVVVVTSDKCYDNADTGRAFVETDPLGGRDPYSASKGAQEIIAHCWRRSFFDGAAVRLATARAGNVIGGGDWAADRLIPDIYRALSAGRPVAIRNPGATRPWQHVLDPLAGYLELAEHLAGGGDATALNFGPEPEDVRPVSSVVARFLEHWGAGEWFQDGDPGPKEARLLTLDPGLAKRVLGWRQRLSTEEAIDWTASWYRAFRDGRDPRDLTLSQIDRFERMA